MNSTRSASNAGVAADAPSLDRAAFTFDNAPSNVFPAFSAAPPMPACIASANVWKSIFPFDTMSDTSPDVTPSLSANSCKTGMPDEVS